MMPSLIAVGRRATLLASLLVALLLGACDSVGEGNTLAFLTITDSRGVQPTGEVEVFQCLPSQLFLVGTFDDGGRDTGIGFRNGVTWTSSDETVVRVSNGEIVIDGITHRKGTLIPSAVPGAVGQTATITATFLGLSASQSVIIRPGTLEVSPTKQVMAVGTALQMFATAIFGQDGVADSAGINLAADFGNFVDWSSSDEDVATVDVNGIVRGITGGVVDITARTGVSCPVSADLTTQVTVQDTDLTDFNFVATNPPFDFADIGLLTSSFVRLIGIFGNGLMQDLTGQAELTSDDATIVSEFSNLVTARGAAGDPDTTTLTASFDQDETDMLDAFEDQQPVTVDDAKSLNALTISPAGPISMFQGTTLDLDVLGTFTDSPANTMQNLYRNVFWTTSDSTLVTVTVAGVLSASFSETDVATITATRTDPLSSVEFAPTLSVSVVDSLDNMNLVVDCQPDSVQIGAVTNCRATATLAGGQTQDVSLSAIWSSGSPSVAEVSNVRLIGSRRNELGSNSPLPGRIYAVGSGSTVIRASLFDAAGNRLATGTDTVTVNP